MRVIAEAVRGEEFAVVSAGISGDRVVDLQRRWESDALAAHPQVLTVLIGVNDMWRRDDSGDATSAIDFERVYDDLFGRAVAGCVESIILMEPFLVQVAWKAEDLAEKIEATRRLAAKYDAALVPLDAVLNAAATRSPEDIAFDGVHPPRSGTGSAPMHGRRPSIDSSRNCARPTFLGSPPHFVRGGVAGHAPGAARGCAESGDLRQNRSDLRR